MTELPTTPAEVIARLEKAGQTLLAMRLPGLGPAVPQCGMPAPVRDFWEAYGQAPAPVRAALPSARDIDAMAEALGWIPRYIPADRFVIRRVLQARCLVNPVDGRHLWPWRRIAGDLRANVRAVQHWHARGIGLLVFGITADRPFCANEMPRYQELTPV